MPIAPATRLLLGVCVSPVVDGPCQRAKQAQHNEDFGNIQVSHTAISRFDYTGKREFKGFNSSTIRKSFRPAEFSGPVKQLGMDSCEEGNSKTDADGRINGGGETAVAA
jgi:hypothetical protein